MKENNIITNTSPNGFNYQIYVPDKIDSNTPIVFYHHGSGGYPHDYNELNEHLNTVGSNAIVVEYNHNNRQDSVVAMDILNDVSQRYNVPETNIRTAGFSWGLEPALRAMSSVIEENPDMETQPILLVDGYWSGYSKVAYDSKVLSSLGNNNTVIFAIQQPNITCNDQQYKKWVTDYGINLIRLSDNTCQFNGSSNGHLGANNNYVWQGLLEFQTGTGVFPSESDYTAQIYDGSNWVPINIAGKTLDQVYNLVGIDAYKTKINQIYSLSNLSAKDMSVTSNSTVLLKYVNTTIRSIQVSSFITKEIPFNQSFNSNTKIPTQIIDFVQKYYNTTATLLLKLANEVQEFAKIGEQIDKDEQKLEQEAINLNNETVGSTITTQLGTVITQPTINNTINNVVDNTKKENTNKIQNTNKESEKSKETKTENNQKNTTTDSNKTETPKKEETKPSNTINDNKNNNNNKTSQSTTSSKEHSDRINDFPDYKELYSDESRIVYNYNDEYKIIIHKDGDKIIGIEYYYDFQNEANANQEFNKLASEYRNNNDVDNIIQSGRYIKIIFNENTYNNMTIKDIKQKYHNLNEIIKL